MTLKKQKPGKKIRIIISSDYSLNTYKDKLIKILIELKIKQQVYAKAKLIQKDRIKGDTSNKTLLVGEISDKDKAIGMTCLSNYLGISKANLSNLVKRLGIKRKEVKENLGKIIIMNEYFDEAYSFVNKKGQTILHYGSVYSFS